MYDWFWLLWLELGLRLPAVVKVAFRHLQEHITNGSHPRCEILTIRVRESSSTL